MLKILYASLGLSTAISGAIHFSNVCRSPKSLKIAKTFQVKGSRSSKVIDIKSPKKHVTSSCYDKQRVCVHL